MNNAKGIIQDEVYFITTTVVNWIDIFTRPKYKHIVLESLDYCRQHKGLIIYAWVLMSNHLHAIVRSESEESVADIMRDFKKHTSKRIIAELQDDMQESRREWMLSQFGFAAANDTKTSKYRFWQDGYHPEQIATPYFFKQKLRYIHNNPIRQEYVSRPADYLYSSAIDYDGGNGLLNVEVLAV